MKGRTGRGRIMVRKTIGRSAVATLVLATLPVIPVAISSDTAGGASPAIHLAGAAPLNLAGTYSYTDSLEDSETLTLSSNGSLTFSVSGCNGEWITSKKTIAMEIGTNCANWVFLGTATKVKVGRVVTYTLSGTGNASGHSGSFTWRATGG